MSYKKLGNNSYFDKDGMNAVYNALNKTVIQPYKILNQQNYSDSQKKQKWNSYLKANKLDSSIQPLNMSYETFLDGMTDVENRNKFYRKYAPIIKNFKMNYKDEQESFVDSFEKFEYIINPGKVDFKFDSNGHIKTNDKPINSQSIKYSFLETERQRAFRANQAMDSLYKGGMEKPAWSDDFIKHMSKKKGLSGYMLNGTPFLQSEEWQELKSLGITPRDYYNWNYRENEENFINMIYSSDNEEMSKAYKSMNDENLNNLKNKYGNSMYYTLMSIDIDKRNNMINMLNALEDDLFQNNNVGKDGIDRSVYMYKNKTFNNYKLFKDLGLIKPLNLLPSIIKILEAQPYDINDYESLNEMIKGSTEESFADIQIDKEGMQKEYGYLWKDALKNYGNNTGVPRNDAEWDIASELLYLELLSEGRLKNTALTENNWFDNTPESLLIFLKHQDNPAFARAFDKLNLEKKDIDAADQLLASLVSMNISSLNNNTWEQVLIGKRREGDANKIQLGAQPSFLTKNISLSDLLTNKEGNTLTSQFLEKNQGGAVSQEIIDQIIENKLPTMKLVFAEHIAGLDNNQNIVETNESGVVVNPGYGTNYIRGGSPKAMGIEPYAPYNTWDTGLKRDIPESEINMLNVDVAVVKTDFKGGYIPVSDNRVINTFQEGKELDATYHFFDENAFDSFANAYSPEKLDAFMDRIELENQGFRLVNLENGELIPRAKDILKQSYAMSYYWDKNREKLWTLMNLNDLYTTTVKDFYEGDDYTQGDYTSDKLFPAANKLLSGATLGLKDLALWLGGYDFGQATETEQLQQIAKALDLNDSHPEWNNVSPVAKRDLEMQTYHNALNAAAEVTSHIIPFIGGGKLWTSTVSKYWSPARNSLGGYINSGLMFTSIGTATSLTNPDTSPFIKEEKEYVRDTRYSSSNIAMNAAMEFTIGTLFHGLNKIGFKPSLTKSQKKELKTKHNFTDAKIIEYEKSLLESANSVYGGRGAVVPQLDQRKMLANLLMQGTAGGTMMHGFAAADHAIHLVGDGMSWSDAMNDTFNEFGFTQKGVENFSTNLIFMSVLHSVNAFPRNVQGLKVEMKDKPFMTRFGKRMETKQFDLEYDKIGSLWKAANRNTFNRLAFESERIVTNYLNGNSKKMFSDEIKFDEKIPDWVKTKSNDPFVNFQKVQFLVQSESFKKAYLNEQIKVLEKLEGHFYEEKGKVKELTADAIQALKNEVVNLYVANINNPSYFTAAKLIEIRQKLADITFQGYNAEEYMKLLKIQDRPKYNKLYEDLPLFNKENIK